MRPPFRLITAKRSVRGPRGERAGRLALTIMRETGGKAQELIAMKLDSSLKWYEGPRMFVDFIPLRCFLCLCPSLFLSLSELCLALSVTRVVPHCYPLIFSPFFPSARPIDTLPCLIPSLLLLLLCLSLLSFSPLIKSTPNFSLLLFS